MGESQSGGNRKQSTQNFPKNEHFLPPDTHVCVSRGKKCSFFGKFAVLCFLVTSVLRFALLPFSQNTSTASEISYPEHFQENLAGGITLKLEYR